MRTHHLKQGRACCQVLPGCVSTIAMLAAPGGMPHSIGAVWTISVAQALEGMQMAAINRLTHPFMTVTVLCVAPVKDSVKPGQRRGPRPLRGSSHSGSRPPQAAKPIQPGKSRLLIKTYAPLPAIEQQGSGQAASSVPGPTPICHPGTSETTVRLPACCVKRRTQGRIRRCRSSWHGLVEATHTIMEIVGIDEAWLQNDLMPYADYMYG